MATIIMNILTNYYYMNKNYTVHKADERWSSDIGWLQSKFSFSFAEYYNPKMMWFWTLRVINDDIIGVSKWFWMHPHSDMEIISIPLSWSLSHVDSMWNTTEIIAGEVQAMSAGTWIFHSEMNKSQNNIIESLQIWILTRTNWIKPSYSQKQFFDEDRKNKIQILVSPYDNEKIVKINQDAYISRLNLLEWNIVEYKKYREENWVYIFLISWNIQIWEYKLEKRDALWIINIDKIDLTSIHDSDVLILEVPMS